MKAFACGALVPNCTITFRADSMEDMLAQVSEHARLDHGLATLPPDFAAQVRAHVRDVPVDADQN